MEGVWMSSASPPQAEESAPGVYRLLLGKGPVSVNVYFVRSTDSWVLVDTGLTSSAAEIREAAESLFGPDSSPTAILLTHYHPDHSGAAAELAQGWQCPVWLHPTELGMVDGDLPAFRERSFPLDRWLILPVLNLISKKRIAAILSRRGLRQFTRVLSADGTVPGLPGWKAVPTPGHTPGHTAFFRPDDSVLLSGDAVTTRWGRARARLGRDGRPSGSPWVFTWNRAAARRAVATLAELKPRVIASGHGEPLSAPDLGERLNELSDID
jgi:glyoxylase-like metal-dependent hydrolase (beta-lactamase superfamily II)